MVFNLSSEDKLKRNIKELKELIQRLLLNLQKTNLAEQIELVKRPKRLIYLNFLAGLARGFGIVVGLTVLGALFLSLLYRVSDLDLPIIGKYIADLVKIVQENL